MPAELTILDASGVNVLTPDASFFNGLHSRLADFLRLVEQDFPTPLSQKVDLDEFAKKILEKACVFIAIDKDETIIGCSVAYCNDMESLRAYGTLSAVHPLYRGGWLWMHLVKLGINIARKHGFKIFAAHAENDSVSRYFESLGFRVISREGDRRYFELKLD